MIVAAFDLATATGVCDGALNAKPRLFSWFLSDAGPERPKRLLMLAELLGRYFTQEPVDDVVYEAPMPLGMIGSKKDKRVMMSEDAVAFSRGAIGVLEMMCARHGKPVSSVRVMDARQAVLGWRANVEKRSGIKTKRRVMQDVAILGAKPENDNEADSFVLWRYRGDILNPRLAVARTPLFGAAGTAAMLDD